MLLQWKQLFEEKQVFHADNKQRERGHDHVAEKMKKDEDPFDAASRGLYEELQVVCSDGQLVHNFLLDSVDSYNPNPSYKGLHSTYRYYNFIIEFNESQYDPSGYKEVTEDKTTYFVWK